jgi:transcriptional regulator with XRE-family HTH domain
MRPAKLIRQLRGKSQFEVSLLTGIPNYRLSRIETGKGNPTPEELAKLATALDTTPTILIQEISAGLFEGITYK